jgi:hypothetical protein
MCQVLPIMPLKVADALMAVKGYNGEQIHVRPALGRFLHGWQDALMTISTPEEIYSR